MVFNGKNVIEQLKQAQKVIESASVALKHQIIYLESVEEHRTSDDYRHELLDAIRSIDNMNQNVRCVDLVRGLIMDQRR